MMEAAPAPALEVIQAEFVLELLGVPLDPPAELGEADELGERGQRGEGRQPILRGVRFPPRPLTHQPLFRAGVRPFLIAMRRPDAEPGKAGSHRPARALAPR